MKAVPECIKCKKEIPDGALYCPWCGKKQSATKKASSKRGNGQGTAYKRGKTWTAMVISGYKVIKDEDDREKRIAVKRTKGGFPTKAAALAYCSELKIGRKERPKKSLDQVYEEWEKKYASRVGTSTMAGYKAAYKHFKPLHPLLITAITAQNLQDCMDACTAGKRTHQLMKVVAGLIWAYAYDADYVDKDVTENLYTGKGESVQREPLTEAEVETIRQAIGTIQYAEYVYALCYLGFRPGEFLRLKKEDLHEEDGISYLVGGSKTKAGKGRKVPVPTAIAGIIAERKKVEGTDLLFPRYAANRKNEFLGYKEMTDDYFNKFVFKPMMARLGIAEGKVPYGARHTYSDKLKDAAGDDKTKAAIMGHTDYAFTQKRYQTTDLEDIKKVAESIK